MLQKNITDVKIQKMLQNNRETNGRKNRDKKNF